MQVEPWEIPFTGAPEILRSKAYIGCTLQQACHVLDTGKDEGNPAKRGTDGRFSTAC